MKTILSAAAFITGITFAGTTYAGVPISALLQPAGSNDSAGTVQFLGKNDYSYLGKSGCFDGYVVTFYNNLGSYLGVVNTLEIQKGDTLAFDSTPSYGQSAVWNLNSSSMGQIANAALTTQYDLSEIAYAQIAFQFDPDNTTTSGIACTGGGIDTAVDQHNSKYFLSCSTPSPGVYTCTGNSVHTNIQIS